MKTIEEINKKIRSGQAVVLTAGEAKALAEEKGVDALERDVDVVTTATFSPMCSSGLMLNTGHVRPGLKMQKARLDGVPLYGGVACVDLYLGATEEDPDRPGYGGAHVIHKLLSGERLPFEAEGRPSDCYPTRSIRATLGLEDLNQAYLFNPRNLYQNYDAAWNSSDKPLYTYMGRLQPGGATINYASAGEWSPLLNDPRLRCFGLGTRLLVGGGEGYVVWEGTQYNQAQDRDPDTDLPVGPGATLALMGELRGMSPDWVRPVSIPGYGVSLYLGIAAAIPVLDRDMARALSIRNRDIRVRVNDYAGGGKVGEVSFAELEKGRTVFRDRDVTTRTMSDNRGARKLATLLRERIQDGDFLLTQPVLHLPVLGRNRPFSGTVHEVRG